MVESDNFLRRHNKIGVDSNIFIALIEEREYSPSVKKVFQGFRRFNNEVWFSAITITEVLIHPLKLGRFDVVIDYENRLFNSPFSFAKFDLSTARKAAVIGAKYNFKVVDSLVVASLLEHGITGFISADKIFSRIKEIDVLILS